MWAMVATTAAVATAGISAYSAIEQGKAAEDAAEAQARQAESEAVSQLVERKRALIESLASQNVSAAGQGRTISSISTLQQEDLRRAGYDEKLIKGGAAQSAQAYRTAGKQAKRSGYLKAGSSLLSGVSSAAKFGASSGGGGVKTGYRAPTSSSPSYSGGDF